MIGRVLWFALGAGVAVYGYSKVRATLQQATPQALGQRATSSAVELAGSARGFVDRARAAMAEREAELREALEGGARSDALGRPEPE